MRLSSVRQIKIIADLLRTGTYPVDLRPRQFDPPWREYFTWCLEWLDSHDSPDAASGRLRDDFGQAFGYRSPRDITNHARLQKFMDVDLQYDAARHVLDSIDSVRWLWPGWLPRGLTSLLAAAPGTGKSYLALELARCLIAGTPFPDGAPVPQSGPVLFVDAENTPTIHKQRLSVWPAELLDQLYFMLPMSGRFAIDLNTLADRDRLSDMVWALRPLLVIVDSYGSVVGRGENVKENVQDMLAFFNQLAKEFDCSVLLVHHLRKARAVPRRRVRPLTLDAIRGSSHITAIARQIWALQFVPVGPEPRADDPRRLWVLKSNVGAPPPPLGVTFSPHPDHPDVAQLTFGDAPQPYKPPTRVDECAQWLLELLAASQEPLRRGEILERARDAGFNNSLLYRARRQLGDRIVNTHGPRHPQNAWALSEGEASGDPEASEVSATSTSNPID
jgi:hypothetical protein